MVLLSEKHIFFSDGVDLETDIRSTIDELNSRGMKISHIAGDPVPSSPTGAGRVQRMMLDAHTVYAERFERGVDFVAVPQSSHLEKYANSPHDRITSLKKTYGEAEAAITSLTKAYDKAKAAITSLTKAYDEAKVGLSARSRNDQLDLMKDLLDRMRSSIVKEEATLTKTREDAAQQNKRIKAAERFMETVQVRHGEERRAAFASSSSAAAAAATSTASSSAAASAGATAPSAMGDEFAASSHARRKRRSSAIQCDDSRRRVLADDPSALAERNTGFSKPEGEDDEVQFMDAASSAPPHKRRKKPAKKKKKKKKDQEQAQVTPPLRVIATNPHERSTALHAQWEREFNGAE